MTVRCKFRCTEMHRMYDASDAYMVRMEAVTEAGGGVPEDEGFTKYTPSGTLTFACCNPNAIRQLVEGHEYYIDIVPLVPQA